MPRSASRERVEKGLYRQGDVYLACVTPEGSRQARWKTLGRVGVMEARRLREEFVNQLRRGELPAPGTRKVTFGDVARAWLETVERLVELDELAPRTRDGYREGIERHIYPEFEHRPIVSIGPDDLVRWHTQQRLTGVSAWTIRKRWMPFRLALGHGARHGIIPTNPADQLTRRERPKPGPTRVRHLSRDELSRLMHETPRRYRVAVATGLFAGLRISELLGLTWDDVDFDQRVLRVRWQMESKGRQPNRRRVKTEAGRRDVVMMPALATLFRHHRLETPWSRDQDLVFATRVGTTIGQRNLASRGLGKASEAARIDDVSFHVLRHTFASILIAQGRDVVFVSRQLGHTSPGFTLRVYAHLFDAREQAEKARDQLDAEYGALLKAARG